MSTAAQAHPSTAAVLDALKASDETSITRLIDWLTLPSISTDASYKDHCVKAAEWAAAQLRECGLTAAVHPTGDPAHPGNLAKGGGHPIVLAHSEGSKDYKGPHVLFYGHYDVQPCRPHQPLGVRPLQARASASRARANPAANASSPAGPSTTRGRS
jgi:acetylornithine deacetylase/succinyl-diaminopimelate desuccinylase-like protein